MLQQELLQRRRIEESKRNSTPEIFQFIEDGLNELNTRVEGFFVIAPTPEVMENKTVIVEDGRPILFRERERRLTDSSMLTIGVVAGRKDVTLTNPDILKGDGLDPYFRARTKVEELGIDLTSTDHGMRIDLDTLSTDDQIRVVEAVEASLQEDLGDTGQRDVTWLQHNKFNPTLGRNLKAIPYRITRGEAGRIEVEENPNKRFSRLPLEVAYTVTPVSGVISESDRAEQARFFAARNGVQKFLFEAVHRAVVDEKDSCITVDEGSFSADEARTTVQNHPELFKDPIDTHKASKDLRALHTAIVSSGAWLTRTDIFPTIQAVFSFDAFSKSLSNIDPDHAQDALVFLGSAADYYANYKIPDFAKTKEVETKSGGGRGIEQKPPGKPKESVGERLYGLSEDINPTSVLGVSTMFGSVERGVVVPLHERKDYDPTNTHVVYGTTDFANPVEAIMVRVAAENTNGEVCPATYFADDTSHTIGSYSRRILIPTVATLYNLPPSEQNRLVEASSALTVHDMHIADMLRTLGSKELADYMQETMRRTGLSTTFKDFYRSMNEALCSRLGIKYLPAADLLNRADITVGDAEAYAREIAVASREQFEAMKDKLTAQGLKPEEVDGFLQNIWGNEGAWDIDTRQFFRVNTGTEGEVPFSAVDHSLRFGELADHGITLGGNGWVVFEQLAAERYSDYDHTVLAHKNTKLGVNYSVPPLIAKKTSLLVSPIVRVVPDHNNAIGGDGLDIGAYIQNPALIDHVAAAFRTGEGSVNGGQKKVVLAVDTPHVWINGEKVHVKTVEESIEPMAGGHRRFVQLNYI